MLPTLYQIVRLTVQAGLLATVVATPAAAIQSSGAADPDRVVIDADRIAAVGIQSIEGKHLTLFTDARDRSDMEELVAAFDRAVLQWCEYFSVDPSMAANWKVRAFLMADPARFQAAGLIPPHLPKFLAGYALGDDIWFYPQPGNYYTRHLLLHEGTHAFMTRFLGSSGPAWYSEGMAEWLGLHRWQDGQLTLGYAVKDRRETEYWGRVKIIRDDLQSNNAMTLDEVLHIDPAAFLKVRSYAWAWAACEFLMNHPATSASFAKLQRHVDSSPRDFLRRLWQPVRDSDRDILQQDWNLFIHELDYGYSVAGSLLADADLLESADGDVRFRVSSQRGWQRASIQVNKGDRLEVSGSGEFEIRPAVTASQAGEPSPEWNCQSGGITIRYYRGRPLGMLLAGVLSTDSADHSINQPLIEPIEIGLGRTITLERDGQLCFRINEFPGDLGDNRGFLEVSVKELESWKEN